MGQRNGVVWQQTYLWRSFLVIPSFYQLVACTMHHSVSSLDVMNGVWGCCPSSCGNPSGIYLYYIILSTRVKSQTVKNITVAIVYLYRMYYVYHWFHIYYSVFVHVFVGVCVLALKAKKIIRESTEIHQRNNKILNSAKQDLYNNLTAYAMAYP